MTKRKNNTEKEPTNMNTRNTGRYAPQFLVLDITLLQYPFSQNFHVCQSVSPGMMTLICISMD